MPLHTKFYRFKTNNIKIYGLNVFVYFTQLNVRSRIKFYVKKEREMHFRNQSIYFLPASVSSHDKSYQHMRYCTLNIVTCITQRNCFGLFDWMRTHMFFDFSKNTFACCAFHLCVFVTNQKETRFWMHFSFMCT